MKAKTLNMTMEFDPVEIKGSAYSINFRKSVRDGVTTITGNPKKGESDAGFISYNPQTGVMNCQINNITEEESSQLPSILKSVGESLKDIIQG